jgi:hypothetical protein
MEPNFFKHFFRHTGIPFRRLRLTFSRRPADDLSYKQQIILETGWRFGCSTLLETGTYLGDTVNVAKGYFDRVLSVELSAELHAHCRERFRKDRNVFLWQGNSGELLGRMIDTLGEERALFWIDAHYSGSGTADGNHRCPVMAELAAIANLWRKDHCILIDDASLFDVDAAYPTKEEVGAVLMSINPDYEISIRNNIILALPSLRE